MKRRNGFVSNSSTSSFICEVCNTTEVAGHDMSWSDMGISRIECEAGHEMHEDCSNLSSQLYGDPEAMYELLESTFREEISYYQKEIEEESKDAWYQKRLDYYIQTKAELSAIDKHTILEEDMEEFFKKHYDISEGFPSKYCPVCMLESVDTDYIFMYLSKVHGITLKTLEADIKKNFNSLEELIKFLT